MTIQDVENILNKIRFKAIVRDYEAAHGLEDTLYENVLKAIATGIYSHGDSVNLAKMALSSKEIKFERYSS